MEVRENLKISFVARGERVPEEWERAVADGG